MKILILEDDEHIGNLLSMYLTMMGTVPHVETTIDGFIRQLTLFEPRIVVIDLIISGVVSVKAIARTKQINPNIVVVICTAMSNHHDTIQGFKVDHTIQKPFTFEKIDEIIFKNS